MFRSHKIQGVLTCWFDSPSAVCSFEFGWFSFGTCGIQRRSSKFSACPAFHIASFRTPLVPNGNLALCANYHARPPLFDRELLSPTMMGNYLYIFWCDLFNIFVWTLNVSNQQKLVGESEGELVSRAWTQNTGKSRGYTVDN